MKKYKKVKKCVMKAIRKINKSLQSDEYLGGRFEIRLYELFHGHHDFDYYYIGYKLIDKWNFLNTGVQGSTHYFSLEEILSHDCQFLRYDINRCINSYCQMCESGTVFDFPAHYKSWEQPKATMKEFQKQKEHILTSEQKAYLEESLQNIDYSRIKRFNIDTRHSSKIPEYGVAIYVENGKKICDQTSNLSKYELTPAKSDSGITFATSGLVLVNEENEYLFSMYEFCENPWSKNKPFETFTCIGLLTVKPEWHQYEGQPSKRPEYTMQMFKRKGTIEEVLSKIKNSETLTVWLTLQ